MHCISTSMIEIEIEIDLIEGLLIPHLKIEN